MLIEAISLLFTFTNFMLLTIGTAFGIVMGAAPGIGPTLSLTLLLPFAFWLPPINALALMGACYGGVIYGGSITSILVNIPGEPGNAATCFDGHPLARQGKARVALGAACASSGIGGLFGVFCLILLAPILVEISLMFGPAEYFSVAIFGLSVIAVASSGAILQGLVAGGFGLLLSFIGRDPFTGVCRFSFGIRYLEDGLPLIPVLIGLFAIAQVLDMGREKPKPKEQIADTKDNIFEGVLAPFKYPVTLIRSMGIGVILGMIPAAGVSIANLLAYGEAQRASKEPETFGKGNIEGVVAPESANNAVVAASLIPTLSLGVPGTASAAVILSVLIMQGLRPGPDFLNSPVAWAFFLSLIMTNIFMIIMGWSGSFVFAKISDLTKDLMIPIVVVLSIIGSYAMNYLWEDVLVTIIFGFIGYWMRKAKFPPIAIVLALILGNMAEKGFLRALMLADGSYLTFVTRPISLIILIITAVSLIWTSRISSKEYSPDKGKTT